MTNVVISREHTELLDLSRASLEISGGLLLVIDKIATPCDGLLTSSNERPESCFVVRNG